VHLIDRLRPALCALAFAGALCVAPAAPASAAGAGTELGRGLVCVLGNLVYMPVKTIYAAGGALVAGGAWVFSGGDGDVTRPIVDASLRGDYVITPRHLSGQDRLEFVGRSPAQRQAAAQAAWGDGPTSEGF
jgi:hypothetical protein